jgi:hypothetical protein
MTKAKITAHLAGKFDLSKKKAGQFLEELARLAYREAKNSFTLPKVSHKNYEYTRFEVIR